MARTWGSKRKQEVCDQWSKCLAPRSEVKENRLKPRKKDPCTLKEREVPQHPSCFFFQYTHTAGPAYCILVDTNLINFSIKAKLDLVQWWTVRQVYPLYNWLCNGWNWESGVKVSRGSKDCQGSKIRTITTYTQGNLCRWPLSRDSNSECYIVFISWPRCKRSMEFTPWTFLSVDTTLSECQMMMEPLGSNS